MSFYLLSEGLTCLSFVTGAYESLKLLSRAEKGIEMTSLSEILEFWLVLGSTMLFEEYLEFVVSWFPFYYLFKCTAMSLLLIPNTKLTHVLHQGFIEPGVDHAKELVHKHVLPLVESAILQYGHWFHDKLLEHSLAVMSERQLGEYEQNLLSKLDDVRTEIRLRCKAHADINEYRNHIEMQKRQ